MKHSRTAWAVLWTLVLLAMAGCGGSSSASTASNTGTAGPVPANTVAVPTPSPTESIQVTATAVPRDLTIYSALANPILQSTLTESRTVLHKMKTAPISTAGDACTVAGTDFANQETQVSALYSPPEAASMVPRLAGAYRLAIAAADECGIASDSLSKKQMATAAADMEQSIAVLSAAQTTISGWSTSG